MSLSARSEIFNTLTANSKYSHGNMENLPLPIQMQFTKKITFSEIFPALLESTLIFKHFEKKELHSSGISEVIDCEIRTDLNALKVLFLKTLPQCTC